MATGNFILLDAARMSGAMDEAKKLNPLHESLYKAKEDELLQSVAPYLFKFDNQGEFNNYFLEKGWGDSWGVLVSSRASFEEIHKHFRRFLMVKTEDGVELYFRFYDPRVLRIFLPTCDMKQLAEFFGPVQSFLLEDEDPRYGIKFWLQNGELKSKKIHLREIASNTNSKNDPEEKHPANFAKEETLENEPLFPKKIVEKDSNFISSYAPKPTKPKWNMLD